MKRVSNVIAATAATAGGFLLASGLWHGIENSANTIDIVTSPERLQRLDAQSRHHSLMEVTLAASGIALMGCGAIIRIKSLQQPNFSALVEAPDAISPPNVITYAAVQTSPTVLPHSSVIMS